MFFLHISVNVVTVFVESFKTFCTQNLISRTSLSFLFLKKKLMSPTKEITDLIYTPNWLKSQKEPKPSVTSGWIVQFLFFNTMHPKSFSKQTWNLLLALRSCSSQSRLTHSCWAAVVGPDVVYNIVQTRLSPAGTWTEPCSCPILSQSPVLSSETQKRTFFKIWTFGSFYSINIKLLSFIFHGMHV